MTSADLSLQPAVAARAPSPDLRKTNIVGIQCLRALAAILVIVHHAHEQFPATLRFLPTDAFEGGVDIFFVISGFIMMHTTAERPVTPVAFLRRRIVRIVPLYWIMTFVTAGLLIAAPSLVRRSKFTAPDLLASLVFLPHRNAGDLTDIAPMLKLGWTLNFEMFFYVVFAALLVLAPLRRLLALTLGFILLVSAVAILRPVAAPLTFWGNPIVFEFVLGCALGWAESRGFISGVPVAAALAVLLAGAIGLFWFPALEPADALRVLTRGLPGAMMVFSLVCLDRGGAFRDGGLFVGALRNLGDASYSIYLSHLYAVIFFRLVWEKLHLPMALPIWPAIFIVLCVVVGTSAGLLTYRLVERPATAAVRTKLA